MSFYEIKPMKMELAERMTRAVGGPKWADLLDSSDWVLQQKMDGTRCFVKIKYDEHQEDWDFTWLSSNGTPLKHTAATQHIPNIEASLIENRHLHDTLDLEDDGGPGEFVVTEAILDAELITSTGELYVFDMPWLRASLDNVEKLLCEPSTPALSRLVRIEDLLHFYPEFGTVRSLPVWRGAEEKQEALDRMFTRGVEGGVFKHVHGDYSLEPKKRSRKQIKHKFVKDADVVVLERNRGGTENAILGVWRNSDASPTGLALREIGSCSMIGKPDAQPGDVITCKYLYWTGEAMIQPRMVQLRHDKVAGECLVNQFPVYSREPLTRD